MAGVKQDLTFNREIFQKSVLIIKGVKGSYRKFSISNSSTIHALHEIMDYWQLLKILGERDSKTVRDSKIGASN